MKQIYVSDETYICLNKIVKRLLFYPHAAVGFRKSPGVGDCERHGLVKAGQEHRLAGYGECAFGGDVCSGRGDRGGDGHGE